MTQIVLAVDTSNNRTSLALIAGDAVVHHAYSTARDNLGWLRREVQIALQNAQLDFAAISHFAVAHGPGALTGVRVGVGFVQALALGSGKPLVGVNTLSAMALQLYKRQGSHAIKGRMSVALDARMGEIYVADWESPGAAESFLHAQDRVIDPAKENDERPSALAAGPGWQAYADLLSEACELLPDVLPDALEVAQLAQLASPTSVENVHVHYLRREVAKIPERLRQPTD